MPSPGADVKSADWGLLLSSYRTMLLIRRFEEATIELRRQNQIHGTIHPCIGQEAVAVGVCSALQAKDKIVSNHRGHGHLLAKGAELVPAFAELFGRVGGYCRGRGGSMHIADVSRGMCGANGLVAAGAPFALGLAFAASYRRTDEVVVAFFGDGATGEGILWESLLLSSTWSLPVVWVCENNGFAVNTPLQASLPTDRVTALISDAMMPTTVVDGNDVEAVRTATAKAVHRARSGDGPALIEAVTFRQLWHSWNTAKLPDARPQALKDEWHRRDPVVVLRKRLMDDGALTESASAELLSEIDAEIARAIQAALESPFPDASTVEDGLYARAPS